MHAKQSAPVLTGIIAIAMMILPAGLADAADDMVRVYSTPREDGGYDLFADSDHIIPMWIQVSFTSLTNLEPDVELPFGTVIEPGSEGKPLFGLDPTTTVGRIGYGLRVSIARGNPRDAAHDDDVAYLFPFAHGTKHRVSQGYGGTFTHFGENEYALDFEMEIGTPILAARDGQVVEVKEDSNRGGPSAGYSQDANYVLVYHDDGSFGNYVHLRRNGAVVEVGQYVEAGDLIGYSGNTGQSSGPHLHFDVRLPTETGRMRSIPTEFLNYDGSRIQVAEGNHYYAYHPGQPPFEVSFGADLEDEDFADHDRRISFSNRIEFRTEEVDSTIVLYIGNGFDYAIEATITMRMQGIRATAEFPVSLEIPAGRERFVTLLRPIPGRSRATYAPSVRYTRVR